LYILAGVATRKLDIAGVATRLLELLLDSWSYYSIAGVVYLIAAVFT
jgi:hypothetical protein